MAIVVIIKRFEGLAGCGKGERFVRIDFRGKYRAGLVSRSPPALGDDNEVRCFRGVALFERPPGRGGPGRGERGKSYFRNDQLSKRVVRHREPIGIEVIVHDRLDWPMSAEKRFGHRR